MFGDWGALSRCIGWPTTEQLRPWMQEQRLIQPEQAKPTDPKGAFEQLLIRRNHKHSAAFRQSYAGVAKTRGCTDPAFLKFRDTLRRWFPAA